MNETAQTITATPTRDSGAATTGQSQISAEIASIFNNYGAAGSAENSTRLDYPPYRSSILRHPTKNLYQVDPEDLELAAPVFGERDVAPVEADLTVQHRGEPLGERIMVSGRILDGDGRPVRNQLVEIWQANAAGRYIHKGDQHPAPLDPNFTGTGRTLTDDEGNYRFVTIKPGAYPWKNHQNAWRPAHIHFSVFGSDFTERLVTQMYFPGDPLIGIDPIFTSVIDPRVRELMVANYDHELTEPGFSLGYRWNVVLNGRRGTPFEEGDQR